MRRKKLLISVIVIGMLASYFLYSIFLKSHKNPSGGEVVLIIPLGSGISQIASLLQEHGVIPDAGMFRLAAKLGGFDRGLKAGKYAFAPQNSNLDILQKLHKGLVYNETVTIPEGSTARQIAGLLQRVMQVDSTEFMRCVENSELAAQLGVPAQSLEGYLFPETYRFAWGMKPCDVARALVREFFRQLPDSAEIKAEALGYTLHEIVTLASIVEGEAMLDDERPIIAGLYYNRLRKGIRLQADPTIQYIIPDGPRRLLNKDLRIDSPYNTYRYAGLPPGPVNNPGKKSILAVLNPAKVPYIYMVARGDNSHVFSRTLKEHIKAKKEFDKIRRQVARERRRQNSK